MASWLDRNIKKVCRSYRDVRHVCNCRDKNRNHLKIIYKQFSRIEENLIGSKECLPIQIFDLKWNDSTFTKNIFFTKAPNWYNEMPKNIFDSFVCFVDNIASAKVTSLLFLYYTQEDLNY